VSEEAAAAPRQLPPQALEKVWGSADTAPWWESGGRPVGEVWFEPESLPLLIKFIFTSEKLSLQVHPDDAAAQRRGEPRGKTEMWHILRAGEGAQLALGFTSEISLEHLRAASCDGSIEQLVRWIPVQAGESYLVPAGTVHAIGAPLALCEIQQKSDTTYRLYDYGRPRELHLEEGLEVAVTGVWWPHYPKYRARRPWHRLVGSRYFTTDRTDTAEAFDCRPGIVVTLGGTGLIGGMPFAPGQCWEFNAPARIEPQGEVALLRVSTDS
jgi:mannose-6-phosphate isomerase